MEQAPLLTTTEIKFVLWAIGALIGVLILIFSFLGKLMVGYLKSMAGSMSKMENDLSILTNDHSNLKEDYRDTKQRVFALEQKIKK